MEVTSELDARLLDAVQRSIPLTRRPFQALGQTLGISERDCLAALTDLRHGRKLIRQISAIFDSQSLGYVSSLVACRLPADRIEAGAEIIGRHPGVTHSYQRDHDFNLWYTAAVPPDSTLGLERTVQLLHERSGAEATRLLPTIRLFKIGVKLNLRGDQPARQQDDDASSGFTEADRALAMQHKLTVQDQATIRVLQRDLPLQPQPFDAWAAEAGCEVEDLLAAAQRFLERRQMRRFSAVLRHRDAGFGANAMGCWQAPEDQIDDIGRQMAGFDAVSHCYQRPTYPDWPYNLFTMVHAHTREEGLEIFAAMAKQTGLTQWRPLWSTREFKKVRLRYFEPDILQWERQNAPSAPGA